MDLQAPATLVTAWILVPALIVLACAGLGHGISLVSGMSLRALTVPTGFLGGMVLFTALFYLDVAGVPGVGIMAAAAAAGPLYTLLRRRARRPEPDERRGLIWAAVAGAGAYAVALAPLAGSGRSGVLGYVLNDDSSIHIGLIEAISDGATQPVDPTESSWGTLTAELTSGYPIGSYAWGVFGRLLGGIDSFHLWTPLTALTLAMIALVSYSVLRSLRASPVYAGIASVFVGCSHLLYAYNAQGGLKELIMPVAVYATAALFARSLEEGFTGRTVIPALIAGAAGVVNLGYAGVAWIGPVVAGVIVVLVWRHLRGERIRNARSLLIYGAGAVLLGLPAAISSIEFFRRAQGDLRDPNEVGNLFDALSLWQPFGIWLTGDYRFKPPDYPGFTYTALGIALALGILGLVVAIARRNLALPLALLGGVAGALLVVPRTSIYYDAKTYVVLAPALGMATAAGLLLLWRGPLRVVAVLAAGAVAFGVGWSDFYIYQHAWVTPKSRLGELVTIADRYEGQGPMLVADREQYAIYFLRDLKPWDDYGYRQPGRGLRTAGNAPPQQPRAPDLDDYELEHLARFKTLLERKSPGGSIAPAGFEPDYETRSYRVWRRTGPLPRDHVPWGSDGLQGSASVQCRDGRPRDPALRGIARKARRLGTQLSAAVNPDPPAVAILSDKWGNIDFKRAVPAPGTAAGRGGQAGSGRLRIEPGRYTAWLLGSFGPGVRLYADPPGPDYVNVADLFNDLGASAWQSFGPVEIRRGTSLLLGGIGRPWYLSGSKHFNIMGPLLLVKEGATERIERFDPGDIDRLCGRHIDWVEIPA